jgi:hypothetical protein
MHPCHAVLQEAALEALAAITEHSHPACKELLALQPPQQQQQQVVSPASTAATLQPPSGSSGSNGSSSGKLGGAPSSSAAAAAEVQQQSAVVCQLLQLSKQRDAQLRCLVARCISNFHPAADVTQPADPLSEVSTGWGHGGGGQGGATARACVWRRTLTHFDTHPQSAPPCVLVWEPASSCSWPRRSACCCCLHLCVAMPGPVVLHVTPATRSYLVLSMPCVVLLCRAVLCHAFCCVLSSCCAVLSTGAAACSPCCSAPPGAPPTQCSSRSGHSSRDC